MNGTLRRSRVSIVAIFHQARSISRLPIVKALTRLQLQLDVSLVRGGPETGASADGDGIPLPQGGRVLRLFGDFGDFEHRHRRRGGGLGCHRHLGRVIALHRTARPVSHSRKAERGGRCTAREESFGQLVMRTQERPAACSPTSLKSVCLFGDAFLIAIKVSFHHVFLFPPLF